jgi:hypothetical protein
MYAPNLTFALNALDLMRPTPQANAFAFFRSRMSKPAGEPEPAVWALFWSRHRRVNRQLRYDGLSTP